MRSASLLRFFGVQLQLTPLPQELGQLLVDDGVLRPQSTSPAVELGVGWNLWNILGGPLRERTCSFLRTLKIFFIWF